MGSLPYARPDIERGHRRTKEEAKDNHREGPRLTILLYPGLTRSAGSRPRHQPHRSSTQRRRQRPCSPGTPLNRSCDSARRGRNASGSSRTDCQTAHNDRSDRRACRPCLADDRGRRTGRFRQSRCELAPSDWMMGAPRFALQVREEGSWSELVLPRSRYFPTTAGVDDWLNSSALNLDSGHTVRISAKLLA